VHFDTDKIIPQEQKKIQDFHTDVLGVYGKMYCGNVLKMAHHDSAHSALTLQEFLARHRMAFFTCSLHSVVLTKLYGGTSLTAYNNSRSTGLAGSGGMGTV
jgi:hypothetical protein